MQKAGLDQLHRHGAMGVSSWYEPDQLEIMRIGIPLIALPFVFAYSCDNNAYASLNRQSLTLKIVSFWRYSYDFDYSSRNLWQKKECYTWR